MKTTAKKISIIVLVVITTAIIAFANVSSEKIVSVRTACNHPGYEAFSTDYQMYPDYLAF